jgi:N-acetyl-anhydromuramyl-L-alanine amidase AmpD
MFMPNTNGMSGTNTNKNSKPREYNLQPTLVVLTYSVLPNLKETLFILNNHGASVHYMIEENGNQIQFTNDATDQTFCCGKSEFRGQTSLNQVSITIMLINDAQSVYKQQQITKLIDFFQDLAQRYPHLDLKKDIAGLSEVAVQKELPSPRHIAPGRFFPWEQLAQQGFGLFLATTPEQKAEICISPASSQLQILTLQNKLRDYGYAIEANGNYDDITKAWVTRFNERYVPDPTQQLDAGLWSKASQLSLENILAYTHTKTNIANASPLLSSQSSLFNQASLPTAKTMDEVTVQTSMLNMK